MKNPAGLNSETSQNAAFQWRDTWKSTPNARHLSIPNIPTWSTMPKSCGRCREWTRRLAVFVLFQNGPALNVCRKCFVEESNREAAEGVRLKFENLFAQLRPRFIAGGAFTGQEWKGVC